VNSYPVTKEQLKTALYLLLDEVLPKIDCKLIESRGNHLCKRCDDCMYKQLLKRVKNGEQPRKIREV